MNGYILISRSLLESEIWEKLCYGGVHKKRMENGYILRVRRGVVNVKRRIYKRLA